MNVIHAGCGTMKSTRRRPGPKTAKARKVDPVGSSGLDIKTWIGALSEAPTGSVTDARILRWVEGPLRRFFPFQRFFGAYGRLSGGRIRIRNMVTSGHDPAFVASLENAFDLT